MAKPRVRDLEALVRLGKYLKGKTTYVQLFGYQDGSAKHSNKYINVWVDTDFAGCPETPPLTWRP